MKIYLLTILLIVSAFSFGQSSVPEDDSLVYTIPVVVHIMNPEYGKNLVSEEQVQEAIAYINKVFREPYTEGGAAGDIRIRFKLATKDENGYPTNGIKQVYVLLNSIKTEYKKNGVKDGNENSGQIVGCSEKALKALSHWPSKHYLNIWVVNKIDGKDIPNWFRREYLEWKAEIGFASLPDSKCRFSPDFEGAYGVLDGVVVLSDIFTTKFMDKTQMFLKNLVHEIGHYLNLYHVFENQKKMDKEGCPININSSSDGDKVEDTDPVTEYDLPQKAGEEPKDRIGGENPCTRTPYKINTEHNYMSYNPNKYRSLFTNDQKTRMRECLRNERKDLAITFKETGDSNSEKNNLNRFGNNVASRIGEKLVLQLTSGKKNIVLTNNRTDNGDGVNFIFIGYSDDLDSFIVENVAYESSDFSFINRKNGEVTTVPSIDFKIFPTQKKVIFYNEDGDENGNTFSFTEDGLIPLL